MCELVEKYNSSPEEPATLDEKLTKQFTCPISLEIMRDPVMIIASSQTYERVAITPWLEEYRNCPVSKLQLSATASVSELIKDNLGLRQTIEIMRPMTKSEIISELDRTLKEKQSQSCSM
jgi:SUMO ligase MMS21 Smc5/6 complex component